MANAGVPEPVLEFLREKSAHVKSFKAEGVQKLPWGFVLATQTVYFKKPDKVRVETSAVIQGRKVDTVNVFDGAIQWTYSKDAVAKLDMNVLRSALGIDLRAQQLLGTWGDPVALFEGISNESLAYFGRREEDGEPMHVIELASQPIQIVLKQVAGDKVPEIKLRYWIGVEDGLVHKVAEYQRGTLISTQAFRYVQLNEEIPDSLFTFTPPSGVKVMDSTNEALELFKKTSTKVPRSSQTPGLNRDAELLKQRGGSNTGTE